MLLCGSLQFMVALGVKSVSNMTKLVGERIKYFRNQRGLSQEQLALRAGINTSYAGQLERGEKSPTVDTLGKISTALNIPLEEFFQIENKKTSDNMTTTMEKIAFLLNGRTASEQEAIYGIIKQLLLFKDKK